ncbi:MAG: hypothetical protein WBO44_05790 [Saprospiraceae bacterium]
MSYDQLAASEGLKIHVSLGSHACCLTWIPGGTTHLSGSPADAGQEFLEVPQKKPL